MINDVLVDVGIFKYCQQHRHGVRTMVAEHNIIWRENKMEEDLFADYHNILDSGKGKEGQMPWQKKFNRIREMPEYRRQRTRS